MTDNDTNKQRLWGAANDTGTPYVKDAFHTHVCGDNAAGPEATRARVKPAGGRGTKAAAWTVQRVAPGQSCEVWFRFLCGTGEGAATAPVPRSGIARPKSVPTELSSISAQVSAVALDAVDADGLFFGRSDEPTPLTTTASVIALLRAPLSFGSFVSGEGVVRYVTCTTYRTKFVRAFSHCRASCRGGPLLRCRPAAEPVARGPGHPAPGVGGSPVV